MSSCSSSSKIWLNEEEFIEDVKYQVIARPRISKEISLSKIKAMIVSDYELTYNQPYTKLPVTCLLTTKRLKHPVKYSTCDHPHCFELEAFIRLVQLQSSKRFSYNLCPICEAEVDPGDLAIDELFTCLLHSVDRNGVKDLDGGVVRIYENGEWEWDGKKKEKALEDTLELDEEEDNGNQKIEEIELSDSEDDNNYELEAQEQENATQNEDSSVIIIDDDDEVLEIEPEPPIVKLDDEEEDDVIPIDQYQQPSSPISPIITPSASPTPSSPPNPFLQHTSYNGLLNNSRPPSNSRPHLCRTCGRGFKALQDLHQHVTAKQSDGHHTIDNINNSSHVTVAMKKVIAKKGKPTPSNPISKQPLLNKIQRGEGGINRNRSRTMSSTYSRLNLKLSQLSAQLKQQKNKRKVTRLPESANALSSEASASTMTSGAYYNHYNAHPNAMVNSSHHHYYYYPTHQQWPMLPRGHVDPNYNYHYGNYGSYGMYGANYRNNNGVQGNNMLPPHPNNAHPDNYSYTGNYGYSDHNTTYF